MRLTRSQYHKRYKRYKQRYEFQIVNESTDNILFTIVFIRVPIALLRSLALAISFSALEYGSPPPPDHYTTESTSSKCLASVTNVQSQMKAAYHLSNRISERHIYVDITTIVFCMYYTTL